MPRGEIRIQSGGIVRVQGTGTATCYGGVRVGPILALIPPLTGNTVDQDFVVELGPYQTAPNAGVVTWHLTAPSVPGLSIDAATGTLTVRDGYDVFSEHGSVGVYTVGIDGPSNTVPLTLVVPTYDNPSLRAIETFAADATQTDAGMSLQSSLAGGAYALPLAWSLVSAAPGLSVSETTGMLTAVRGSNVDTVATVVVTDRRGVSAARDVAVRIRSAVLARYLRLRRTSGDDFIHATELWSYAGGVRHQPVTGGATPSMVDGSSSTWSNLVDDDPATFARTDKSIVAQIYLDLGAPGRPVDRVTLANRTDDAAVRNRIVGTTLTVETADETILWSHNVEAGDAFWDLSVPLLYPSDGIPPMVLRAIPDLRGEAALAAVAAGVRGYLGGVYAAPVEWSLDAPVPGLTIAPDTGILSAATGSNVNTAAVVVATDRNGQRAAQSVAVNVRSPVGVRYVRLRRTTGDDHLNVAELWPWFGATARFTAVNGGVQPPYLTGGRWQNLTDGDTTTVAIADRSATSQMFLDLGAEFPVDRIRLTNRSDAAVFRDRIVGSTLSVETASGNVLWSHTFTAPSAATYDLPVPVYYPGDPLPPLSLRPIPAVVGDVSLAAATRVTVPYLDGAYASPVVWSFRSAAVPGIAIASDTGLVTVARGVNANTNVTVAATDRNGRRATQTVAVSVKTAVGARYIRLRRTVGSDFLNVCEMWPYYGAVRHTPVRGGATPPYTMNGLTVFPWTNLTDGSSVTFSHTERSTTAQLLLDLGADVPVDRVRITNRVDAANLSIRNRIVGSTLTVETAAGTILWSYTFTTAGSAAYDLPVSVFFPSV